jgi:hypothetical protein
LRRADPCGFKKTVVMQGADGTQHRIADDFYTLCGQHPAAAAEPFEIDIHWSKGEQSIKRFAVKSFGEIKRKNRSNDVKIPPLMSAIGLFLNS